MAESDPDLAASLLAAFSAPTGLKAVPQSEPASAPEPIKQEDIPPITSPEQHLKQEPSQQEPSQQEPVQQERIRQESSQQETPHSKTPPRQSPPRAISEQLPAPAEQNPLQSQLLDLLQQATSQPAPTPGSVPHPAPSGDTAPRIQPPPEPSQHEHPSQPPTAPQPPSSPQKRSRSRTPEADGHGNISEKRLKTDHHEIDHRDVDLSAANWDISAMIENALGSFDEQTHQPHAEQGHGTGEGPAAEQSQAKLLPPRKTEQKRMTFSSNPYYVMRTMSLPLLGSLAIQTLLALSQQSREETLALIADEESEFRKAYDTLKTALGHARRIFSEGSPLLFADELDISDSEDRETIRMSNLAAVSASAFAKDGALLADVHDNFPTVFIPEDGDFQKDLKPLYLDFKTQAMLHALTTAHNPQERSDVLDRFFPPNFDELLTQRHGDSIFQSNREDLVSEVGTRRQELLESILDDEKRNRLKDEYPVNGFLDNLVDYLQSHLTMVIDYAEKYGINIPVSEESVVNEPLDTGGNHDDHDDLSALLQSATSKLLDGMNTDGPAESLSDSLGLGKLIQESLQSQTVPVKDESADANGNGSALLESGGLASLIASKLTDFDFSNTSNGAANDGQHHGLPQVTNGSVQSQYLAQYNHVAQTPYYTYGQVPQQPAPPADGSNLPPNQSFPTSVLYERARQAAVAKSTSTARREGIHSTRRAWTPEEEKALMMGLDMVKGPHWSQILSLFGANGTISDILKDRTQVQLKDKARNLKLFFLKTNSEMPYYLQCVTGELKTRAPGQAARKEAEEKARQNSEEEQARLQGILTLAGGLQHNPQPINHYAASSPAPAHGTPPYARSTPMTPQIGNAQVQPGMATPVSQHMPQAPTVPTLQARAPNMQNYTANMNTTAQRTPSVSTGTVSTPSYNTGAQATPTVGPGAAGMGYSSTSAPPMPSTTVTTPASSPVKVKTEPQDQPVHIQPRPAPQPLRPAEAGVNVNSYQRQTQSPAPRSAEQAKAVQAVPQPLIQLTFPPDPPALAATAPAPTIQQSQVAQPAHPPPLTSAPAQEPQPTNNPQAPTPTNSTTTNYHHTGDLAQLANYQPPKAPFTQQQAEHHQQTSQTAAPNGHQQSNEHHENHMHQVHHEPEHNADMTLLQTLQAALAAAPSG